LTVAKALPLYVLVRVIDLDPFGFQSQLNF